MRKIEYVFKKNDQKTRYEWITEMIKNEGTESGEKAKRLYYYGSNYVYNNICAKLVSDFGTTYNLLMVTKDTNFEEGDAVFTDDIMFEICYIWPNVTKKMRELKNIKWYISIFDKNSGVADNV